MSLEYSKVTEKLRSICCSSLLIWVSREYPHEDLLDAVLLADDVAAAQQLQREEPVRKQLRREERNEVEQQRASALSGGYLR
jgi:hypothetical protein